MTRRRFRIHVAHYAWAEAAGMVLGLLSFPILTRLLSVSDYGTMNLVSAVLGLTVALGKMGVQHAALRGWAEVRAGGSAERTAVFEATVLWGMAVTGLLVMAASALAAWLVPSSWWGEPGVGSVMLLAVPLIVLRVMDSALSNQLRAQEASAALAFYGTARRMATLGAVVAVLWWLSRDLRGFYLASLVVEALSLLGLMLWMFRGRAWPWPAQVSAPVWVSLALFGLPMLGSELATVVLTLSDRFIIQNVLGAQSLGIYAASYNMCDSLRNAALGAMVGAAYPRCMALWESEGREGLQRFLTSFMHHYVMAALFMVALMVAAGGELMVVLASSRYAEGGSVTGWIMAGLAIQTVSSVAGVGLFLAKRTLLAMLVVLMGGVLSIAGNALLVPWAGLRGAGWVVLGVSVLVVAAQLAVARRHAPVVVPWRTLLLYGAVATAAATLALQVAGNATLSHLLLKVVVLSVVYLTAVLLFERHVRSWIRARWTGRSTQPNPPRPGAPGE